MYNTLKVYKEFNLTWFIPQCTKATTSYTIVSLFYVTLKWVEVIEMVRIGVL